jgi:hypothetical protein
MWRKIENKYTSTHIFNKKIYINMTTWQSSIHPEDQHRARLGGNVAEFKCSCLVLKETSSSSSTPQSSLYKRRIGAAGQTLTPSKQLYTTRWRAPIHQHTVLIASSLALSPHIIKTSPKVCSSQM